jgi:adenine specific DNA methylase Mod
VPLTFDSLKDNGSWYCWGIDEPLMDIYCFILKPMIKENKITFRNLITWDKGHGQGQLSSNFRMYPIADEKCLFIMCGVQGADGILDSSKTLGVYLRYMTDEQEKSRLTTFELNNICGYKSIANHWTLNKDGQQKQPRLIQKEDYIKIQQYCINNQIDAFKREYDDLKREYYSTRAYFDNTHDNQNNVWHFDRTSSQERELTGEHATPKPIALCSRAIKSSSREGEIILDVFGGSGSTLIACEQLNRVCYMLELDTHYVDVIINRWEKYTGKKAVLLNELKTEEN